MVKSINPIVLWSHETNVDSKRFRYARAVYDKMLSNVIYKHEDKQNIAVTGIM